MSKILVLVVLTSPSLAVFTVGLAPRPARTQLSQVASCASTHTSSVSTLVANGGACESRVAQQPRGLISCWRMSSGWRTTTRPGWRRRGSTVGAQLGTSEQTSLHGAKASQAGPGGQAVTDDRRRRCRYLLCCATLAAGLSTTGAGCCRCTYTWTEAVLSRSNKQLSGIETAVLYLAK